MRLLKLPNALFLQVAYAGPQSVLTTDTQNYAQSTRLWNLAGDAEPLELDQGQAALARLLFKPGGTHFLHTQGVWPDDEPLPVAPLPQRIREWLIVEDNPDLLPFAFGPDGATVLLRNAGVIGDQYRTHFHLKTPDGAVHDLYRAWGMFTGSAAFSPNGRLAAMSNGLRIVSVWDVTEHREVCQLEQSDRTNALAFTSDAHLVVAAGRSVRLWDVIKGRTLSKFRAFRKFVDALAVSHDWRLFAAGSRDGLVRIWDSASGCELKEYAWGVGEIRGLAFSPDGATAAAAGFSAVAVWDVD